MEGESNKQISVTGIYCYPIKSSREKEMNETIIVETGLINDRVLAIIDKKNVNNFITMMFYPKVYDIICEFSLDNSNILTIKIPNCETEFQVDMDPKKETLEKSKIIKVKLWEMPADVIPVDTEGDELNLALSEYFGLEVMLVKPITMREFKSYKNFDKFTGNQKETDKTFFADDAPLLVTSEESFNYINNILIGKGETTLDPINFRPNIILSGGGEEFWEGKVNKLKVGDIVLRRVKPCVRCKVTTFNNKTKTFRASKEPLETLCDITFDDKMDGVVFGQYFAIDIPDQFTEFRIKIGDTVSIIE